MLKIRCRGPKTDGGSPEFGLYPSSEDVEVFGVVEGTETPIDLSTVETIDYIVRPGEIPIVRLGFIAPEVDLVGKGSDPEETEAQEIEFLAKLAYTNFCSTSDFRAPGGEYLPGWHQLTTLHRAAWLRATRAIVLSVEDRVRSMLVSRPKHVSLHATKEEPAKCDLGGPYDPCPDPKCPEHGGAL